MSRVVAVALTLLSLAPGAPAAEPESTDVIVVGSGISGLSAALEAARGGASVRVVEMWSVFGGHAVMAHGGLCLVDTPIQHRQGVLDSPALAERDFLEWGEDADPAQVSRYVHRSRELVYDWLLELGVRFSDRLIQIPGNSVPRFHSPLGRGLGLVTPILRACLRHPGVRFEWNTRALELVSADGRVTGVRAVSTRSAEKQVFEAEQVILATGGFQSNLEMVKEFWPERHPFPERLLVGSGVNSVGSGHRIAEAAGATLVDMGRQWNYATGLPDPRRPGTARGVNASNGASIWVNLEGRRFVNETASTKERLAATLRQPRARYWAVFDAPGRRRLFVSGSDWADRDTVERLVLENPALAKKAQDLARLGEAMELPKGVLEETVARYNAALEEGVDEDFQRFGHGGVPYDLAPGSEQGAVLIVTPPFYALPFFPLARKSMGGVAVDLEGRVLDTAGHPIPGLRAVGELTGFGGVNGWAGLEGTFLGPSVVTGRTAATSLLAELSGPPRRATPEDPPRRDEEIGPAPADADCMMCHDLPSLVERARPGYAHFEAVHRVVSQTARPCLECHASLWPFDPDAHVVDRLAQAETCGSCHLAREH